MFLEQGIKPQNKFWKYLLGSVFIVAGFSIGQILISLLVFLSASLDHTKLPDSANRSLGHLPPNITLSLLLITYGVALAGIYFVFRYLHRQTWTSVTTSRPKTDWRRIFFAFGMSAAYWTLFYSALVYFWPDEQVFIFKPIPFAIYFIIVALLTFVRALTEQVVYLGYLMQGFANLSRNRWFPMVMASVIPSLIYITHPEIGAQGYLTMFLFQFIYSLFFCILTLMDEGIELAVGFYAAAMLANQCFWTSGSTAIKTASLFMTADNGSEDGGIGLENILGRLIIIPMFLLLCSKKYGWKNWRKKLSGGIKLPSQLNKIEKSPDEYRAQF